MDIYIYKSIQICTELNFHEKEKKTRLHCSWRVLIKCIRIYRWLFNCSFHKTSDGLQFETDCWTNIGYFLKLLLFFFFVIYNVIRIIGIVNCDPERKKNRKTTSNFTENLKLKERKNMQVIRNSSTSIADGSATNPNITQTVSKSYL